MNKKFTFMVAALLAAGALTSVQAKDLAGAAGDGKYYKLVRSAQFSGTTFTSWSDIPDTDDMCLILDDNGKLTVSDKLPENINEALWKVSKGSVPNTFVLENKAGKTLTYKDGVNEQKAFYTVNVKNITTPSASTDDAFSINLGANGENNLMMLYTSDNAANEAGWKYTTESNIFQLAFNLVEAKATSEADIIKALNSTMGGDGFTLVSADEDITVDDANNIFSTQVKAVKIDKLTNSATGEEIPAGTYLVMSSSCPDALKETGFDSSLSNDDKWEIFEECEFVAVSSSENYGTSKVNKEGLKLVFVKGSELNKYTSADADKLSKDNEISVQNAVFTLAEPDSYTNPGQYTLTVANARIVDSSKTDGSHTAVTGLSIGVTTISNIKYVTTTDENTSFKVGQGTLVKAISLLKEEKAPSIFTMQFLSREGVADREYGKYLGATNADKNNKNTTVFSIQGDALVDLTLPQYQFVISDIDTDKQTVTFSNIEKDAVKFTAYLYETEESDVYKVVTTENAFVADDDAKSIDEYTSRSMNGMIVKLTPVELDAYAGFVKLALNNNTPYKLSFAKTDASDNKLYVAMKENSTTATTLAETTDLQVVFEPVVNTKGEVVENENSVSYVYNNDDRKFKASEDMTIYYTYQLRVVDSQDKNYIKTGTSGYKLEVGSTGDEYVLKYRHDGSVAMVRKSETTNGELNSTSAKLLADLTANNEVAKFGNAYTYAVPEADELSLFLEAEKLGVSLAAKPVHVSLESENGGFLNVNEANEGVVAIRTEAAEDLTFWLDTTNSEAFIPSFYISKGGKFMYNSTDSLMNGSKQTITTESKAKYGVGETGENAKAIFKAGTLVNPDTLTTTVDGKEVMIAEKANQNKGILAGIEKFQYHIVKASDAEDNYVIRNVDGTAYLTNFNGVLGFIANKDNAMRVIVETQSAPTSNEGVSATEVKVVANNGSVVVKNAAGKNVIVSTILGQVVANEVLTSDNATINVPAGIVVVAVEGESFKVNVK